MCCVIPPNSWSTTLDLRSASNNVVLPWSTCPIIVTTGGRVHSLGTCVVSEFTFVFFSLNIPDSPNTGLCCSSIGTAWVSLVLGSSSCVSCLLLFALCLTLSEWTSVVPSPDNNVSYTSAVFCSRHPVILLSFTLSPDWDASCLFFPFLCWWLTSLKGILNLVQAFFTKLKSVITTKIQNTFWSQCYWGKQNKKSAFWPPINFFY